MNASMLVDIAGWVGAVLILAGYGLLTAGRLTSRDPAYQWMNVVGAIGFIINSAWHAAWPSAILNVIWVGIGVVALVRMGMGMGKNSDSRSS
jgi:hypothetical protein